jgi:hypothetical protein
MRINDYHFTVRLADLYRKGKNQPGWNKWKKPAIYIALATLGAVGVILACRTLSSSTPSPFTPNPKGKPDIQAKDASVPENPLPPSECCLSYSENGIDIQECDVDCPSLPPGSTLLPSPSHCL